MAEVEVTKRCQHCTVPSGQEILDLRDLQGDSRCNTVDPSSKDNVFFPNCFFECISLVGCAINVHSMNS